MAEVITDFLLAALWVFCLELLYIRLRDVFFRCELTGKKFAVSVTFAILSAFMITAVRLINYQSYLLAIAPIPIVLLVFINKASKLRTKVKIMIMAVYFHIFWQILPKLDIYLLAANLVIISVIILLAKAKFRKHKLQDSVMSHGSISKIWE